MPKRYILEIEYESGAIERIVSEWTMADLQCVLLDRFALIREKRSIGKIKFSPIVKMNFSIEDK